MRRPAEPGAYAVHAQRLKKLRVERGLTQKQLSLAAGLAKDLVWRWEQEVCRPQRRSLMRLAMVLGVEPDNLLMGDQVPKPVRSDETRRWTAVHWQRAG